MAINFKLSFSSADFIFEMRMNPYLFLSSLLTFISVVLAADPDMRCEVSSCGNVTEISYPFWLSGEQPSYCGFPAFQLQCKDGNIPLIETPYGEYEVKKIFYGNNSFLVADTSFIHLDCPFFYNNLSFDDTPFTVSSSANTNRMLYFLSACSRADSDYFYIACADNVNGTKKFAHLRGNYRADDYLEIPCSDVFYRLVLGYPGANSSQYRTLMTNGFLLNWTVSDCQQCTKSNGQCGYSNDTDNFICICPDRLNGKSCDAVSNGNKKIIIGATGGFAGILFIIFLLLCMCSRKFHKHIFWRKKSNISQNVEAFLEIYGTLAQKRYTYSDVKKITHSFHNKLGQGGFGSVYKGNFSDGRLVAVKVLSNSNSSNGEDFVNEIASIGRSSHVNVVNLLGFCSEGSNRALIYEYMCNGSLDKLLSSDKPKTTPDWERLYRIAIGIARGLEYLHHGCNTKIVHFDIKPHNILLDEDFCPKISDFGLAKLCHQKDSILSMECMRGTIGYIAPEVFSRNFGVVSSKSDIYSYGMMVLEMAGGRKNMHFDVQNTSDDYFPHWIYKYLEENEGLVTYGVTLAETEGLARKMILIGLWCIQTRPQNRPPIARILEMWEGSVDDLQIPPKPNLSLPPTTLVSVICSSSICDSEDCNSAVLQQLVS